MYKRRQMGDCRRPGDDAETQEKRRRHTGDAEDAEDAEMRHTAEVETEERLMATLVTGKRGRFQISGVG